MWQSADKEQLQGSAMPVGEAVRGVQLVSSGPALCPLGCNRIKRAEC